MQKVIQIWILLQEINTKKNLPIFPWFLCYCSC